MSADPVAEESIAVSWARNQHVGGPAEYAVLLILAMEADRSGTCRLSTRAIAEEVGTDPGTVRRIADRLKVRGLVSWVPGKGRASTTYRLSLPVVGGQCTHYTTPSRP